MAIIKPMAELDDILGESPIWDSASGALWWIDIHGRRLNRLDWNTSSSRSVALAQQVGSISLRLGGGLLAATRTGFAALDSDTGTLSPIVTALHDQPDVRFNDGRVDHGGRFWSGTVQEKRTPGGAALYRLSADGACTCVLTGVTVSNGLAWSPDGRTMYFADSFAREIYAFDFDDETGVIANRRIFAEFPSEYGVPDGAVVDVDGYLWSAGMGGWHLLRFDPEGELEKTVRMPVSQPTSCTFGGPSLNTLFVTSASMRLDGEQRRAQPLAGALFALDVGTCGFDERRFGG